MNGIIYTYYFEKRKRTQTRWKPEKKKNREGPIQWHQTVCVKYRAINCVTISVRDSARSGGGPWQGVPPVVPEAYVRARGGPEVARAWACPHFTPTVSSQPSDPPPAGSSCPSQCHRWRMRLGWSVGAGRWHPLLWVALLLLYMSLITADMKRREPKWW